MNSYFSINRSAVANSLDTNYVGTSDTNSTITLHIWFADTDGTVFGADDTLPSIGQSDLGALIMSSKTIVIVDRRPSQITTQLSVPSLIRTLKQILNEVYDSSKIQEVLFHLPRMAYNMLDQANIQFRFQSIRIASKSHPEINNQDENRHKQTFQRLEPPVLLVDTAKQKTEFQVATAPTVTTETSGSGECKMDSTNTLLSIRLLHV